MADAAEQDEPDAVEAAGTLLSWFDTGWRIAYAALMGFGLIVLVAIVWTRRWRLGRDVAVAVAAVLVIAVPVGRAVRYR